MTNSIILGPTKIKIDVSKSKDVHRLEIYHVSIYFRMTVIKH